MKVSVSEDAVGGSELSGESIASGTSVVVAVFCRLSALSSQSESEAPREGRRLVIIARALSKMDSTVLFGELSLGTFVEDVGDPVVDSASLGFLGGGSEVSGCSVVTGSSGSSMMGSSPFCSVVVVSFGDAGSWSAKGLRVSDGDKSGCSGFGAGALPGLAASVAFGSYVGDFVVLVVSYVVAFGGFCIVATGAAGVDTGVGSVGAVGSTTSVRGSSNTGGSNQRLPILSSQNEQDDHSGTSSRILVGPASMGSTSLQMVAHCA